MWKAISLAILGAWPSVALSQGVPGTNLVVDVQVAGVSMSGDVVHVEYVLRNRPESTEDLFVFTVDAPSPVLHIQRPEPPEGWRTSSQYRGSSVARWTMLGAHLAPGA